MFELKSHLFGRICEAVKQRLLANYGDRGLGIEIIWEERFTTREVVFKVVIYNSFVSSCHKMELAYSHSMVREIEADGIVESLYRRIVRDFQLDDLPTTIQRSQQKPPRMGPRRTRLVEKRPKPAKIKTRIMRRAPK